MKQFILVILFLGITNLYFAQHFNLASTEFEVGETYVANPKILYDLAKWTIRPECYDHLDSIADFLIEHDQLVIEIGTHSDSRGSDQCSMQLHLKRSQSIRDYLITKGVRAERLIAKGYGETQLIISDKEINQMKTAKEIEEAHAVNRRTEFKIIEIKK